MLATFLYLHVSLYLSKFASELPLVLSWSLNNRVLYSSRLSRSFFLSDSYSTQYCLQVNKSQQAVHVIGISSTAVPHKHGCFKSEEKKPMPMLCSMSGIVARMDTMDWKNPVNCQGWRGLSEFRVLGCASPAQLRTTDYVAISVCTALPWNPDD